MSVFAFCYSAGRFPHIINGKRLPAVIFYCNIFVKQFGARYVLSPKFIGLARCRGDSTCR